MLAGASERFIEIPDGNEGSLATLRYMAAMMRAPDPEADTVSDILSLALETHSDAERAETVFEWVRRHLTYTPDHDDGLTIEEIRTPGYLLIEIERLGTALGDCDDYVVLLGALLIRLGYPVTLVAISRHEDQQLDHVYLAVDTDEGRYTADGIVAEPFGWEVPEDEVTNRVEVPV